jgi:hypothetical protein
MAYFTVYSTQTVIESATVEADTEAQAREIVLNDTGSLDWQYIDSDNWAITDILKEGD